MFKDCLFTSLCLLFIQYLKLIAFLQIELIDGEGVVTSFSTYDWAEAYM